MSLSHWLWLECHVSPELLNTTNHLSLEYLQKTGHTEIVLRET